MKDLVITTHQISHLGITKLYLQLRQQYYSPKLRQIIEEIVSTCSACQPAKAQHPSNLQPIFMTRLQVPYSMYYCDVKGPLRAAGAKFNYILALQESWSDYITLVPLKNTTYEDIAYAYTLKSFYVLGNLIF